MRRSSILCSAVHTVQYKMCNVQIQVCSFNWGQFVSVTGGVSAAKQHRVQWSVVQYDVQYKVFFVNWGQCAVTECSEAASCAAGCSFKYYKYFA